jgi:DNA-binding transcriptional LysR family regulator
MINLEWYRIFLHTARSGNFTKAAEQLHITQPSVSYAIKQLEELLGLRLFQRLSKGVVLTAEGAALLHYVEQSFHLLDAGEQHLNKMKRLTEGEIRIGASDSLIKHLLLPQLDRFHREYPHIRIRLTHGRTPDIARRLQAGQIDCAIVHLPIENNDFYVRKLAELDACFVVGERYLQFAERLLTAGELGELPLLLMSPGSSTRECVEQWFAAEGIAVQPDMELGSVDLLAEFARLGFGAAFISRSFVEEDLSSGKLFELKLDAPLPARSIGFATRSGMPLSIAADRFADMLLAATPALNEH